MTKVTLHGRLGEIIGRSEWMLHIKSPGEALRLIDLNVRGKLLEFLRGDNGGMTPYRILVNNRELTCLDEAVVPLSSYDSIDIIPVLGGAAGNTGMNIGLIIIGVILVIIACFTYGSTAYQAGSAFAAAFASMSLTLGLTLIIAGVSNLLAPSPSEEKSKKNEASYLFNGAVNTVRQGNPVPVGYGELIIGSQVISAGVRTTPIPRKKK